MKADHWNKIEAAFQEAVSLQGDAQDAFVAEFARRQPALVAKLRDLLAADAGSDTDLREPIAKSVESLASESRDPWLGREVGSWTITRRLADGGMGAVFLAERSDQQYTQCVAVKLMAAQLLAPEAISRFKAERQILANLNHPYIAKLIDGGSTDDGLPYLVMEYVDGLPIDRHCDENRLRIDRRLALFCKVCEAVDYAHRNLVVHRDLKPNNILIDAHGSPKLLDFGIAKLLEAGAYNQTIAMTREGARAMTPEYASPEQVRGEPISVASDVYSLGVLLFRLMTGQSPYGATPTTRGDYERAIVDVDPNKPSTVVTTPDNQAQIGEQRATSVDRLRRLLQGDLDNIVLKSLQKDAQRRYATANDLSADIGRYLRHEPVQARGDDWWYRSRKFAVRNARGLAVAAVALATITGLVTYYTAQLADERDRANLAAAEANEVSEFLSGLFESASPHRSKGEPITAVDLLRQGQESIADLNDQPQLQARLMRIMASNMTALGNLDEAIPMLEQALAMKEAETPPDAIAISQVTHNLAEAHRQNGDLDKAEQYERRTLAIAEDAFGPTDNNVAYLMARLGVILFDARKTEDALDIERRGLDILIANDYGESSSAIDVRGNMANALSRLGRYEEAEALHRETIKLSIRVDGEMAPNTIIRTSNLGLVLVQQGKFEEAVSIFEDSIERGIKVWPSDHEQLAFMIGSKAAALKRFGRMDESLAAYRQAADITRAGRGEDSSRYVRRLRGIGSVQMDMARYAEADATFERALALAIELDDDNSREATLLRVFRGRSYLRQKRYAEAEASLAKASPGLEPLSSSERLVAQRSLAVAISNQGRYDEAEPVFLKVLAEKEADVGSDNPTLVEYLTAIAAHYRRAGELDRSLQYAERGYRIAQSEAAKGRWAAAGALVEYAHTLRATGRADEAQRFYREAHDLLQATFGVDDSRAQELAVYLN